MNDATSEAVLYHLFLLVRAVIRPENKAMEVTASRFEPWVKHYRLVYSNDTTDVFFLFCIAFLTRVPLIVVYTKDDSPSTL